MDQNISSRYKDHISWREGVLKDGQRMVAAETAVALSFNGSTYAVMMATPQDLRDFAIGFSLSEGIIERPDQLLEIDIHHTEQGIDLRMWLSDTQAAAHIERRRILTGPVGCGLCGVDSLAAASRPLPRIQSSAKFNAIQLLSAMNRLASMQPLHQATRAVHAAGWWAPASRTVMVREDVGRHNALDKLAGALASKGGSRSDGAILLTSRVSVEMVQKGAAIGAPVIVAISAPTTAAIASAELAGITLAAIARDDGFELFSEPHRIVF